MKWWRLWEELTRAKLVHVGTLQSTSTKGKFFYRKGRCKFSRVLFESSKIILTRIKHRHLEELSRAFLDWDQTWLAPVSSQEPLAGAKCMRKALTWALKRSFSELKFLTWANQIGSWGSSAAQVHSSIELRHLDLSHWHPHPWIWFDLTSTSTWPSFHHHLRLPDPKCTSGSNKVVFPPFHFRLCLLLVKQTDSPDLPFRCLNDSWWWGDS